MGGFSGVAAKSSGGQDFAASKQVGMAFRNTL